MVVRLGEDPPAPESPPSEPKEADALPRAVRSRLTEFPCCYHITQRCQERRYPFQGRETRRRYLVRLHEMARSHPVSVLGYMVTSNHIHLLMWSVRPADVSEGMRFLAGVTAQDYNRANRREGSVWSGRYHSTLVESGQHFCRCLFYIEMNMVRARAVTHPPQWLGSACKEHMGLRQRYRVIDMDALCRCLACGPSDGFRSWYAATIEDLCRQAPGSRERFWSESAAVGSREWITSLAGRLPESHRRVVPAVSERDDGPWCMRVGAHLRRGLGGLLDRTLPPESE